MTAPDPLERWAHLRAALSKAESGYRKQRLCPGGWSSPRGPELEQLMAALEEVSGIYLAAGDALRAEIRAFFHSSKVIRVWLLNLARSLTDRGEAGGGEPEFLLALAAMSIENNHSDYRDTFVLLGRLYHRALRIGIDPRPLFDQAAQLSSGERDFEYNHSSMREFLHRFEQSAFFREDVFPYLEADRLALERH